MMSRYLAAAAVLFSLVDSAKSTDRRHDPENDPRGAVLCYWTLYMGAEIAGERCFPNDPFRDPLKNAMNRMERFIIENKPTTQETIDIAKQNFLGKTPNDYKTNTKYCTKEDMAVSTFTWLKNRGVAALDQEMSKLLAVPRKPVMNPCI